MSYCFNPDCPQPQNPDGITHCQQCGWALQLQDRYQAIRLLGQGGFGRTLLAIAAPNATDREPSACVIKQFLPQPLRANHQDRARTLFHQEAQRLAELGQHPQIPDFFDFFQAGEQLYLVQEYIAGVTLAEQLATQGVFTEAQIWQVLTDLLPVLKFIHDRQVIHRDIKPENIIRPVANELANELGNNAPLVLVDFGSAKVVTPIAQLQTGTTIGSAEYVAPEQARGKAVFASDLYSLGVTCIHLLTGLSPFDLVDSGHNTWVWQQFLTTPVSPELGQMLDRLIHPALDQRFPSADAVMQAMSGFALINPKDARSQKSRDRALSQALPINLSCPCESILRGHTAAVNTVAVNTVAMGSEEPLIVSGGQDKVMRFWNLKTGQPLQYFSLETPILSVAFSADGKRLAAAGQDNRVRVWLVETLQASLTLAEHTQLAGHTQAVKAIAFHPQYPILASGSRDKTIRIWQVQTRELVATLTQHRLAVNTLAFSPDGAWLASGGSDHRVCLWRVHGEAGKPRLTHHKTLTDHVDSVLAVAFSPDSQTLATGGDDRTIKLWDVAQGHLQQTLSAHSWSVSALSFSPITSCSSASTEKPFLISGGWDGLLKLWPIAHTEIQPAALSLSGQKC